MSQTDETILVGTVMRAHGLRGDVVVFAESDVDARFEAGSELLVTRSDGRSEKLRVLRSAPYKDRLLVRFEGCDDRDRAEELRGCELRVARTDVPVAPEGEFYYFELLDCACSDLEAGDLGTVVAVVDDGGGQLLEVEGEGRRLLVPFVEAFIRRIDVGERRIELELPPGLVETCASTS